jgi:hypothetical protein
MRFPCFKAYFLEVTWHWRNFTYEVVGERRRLKKKKIVSQKLNIILFFDIEFFKYFSQVLHEASSSWLKFCRAFQGHPV